MQVSKLAPIVLFTYKRPRHLAATIESLAANVLARDSDLTVYSDAPRTNDDAGAVSEVRTLLKNIRGFRSVNVVERTENFGLARSIINGVGDAVLRSGRVIVLEDDMEVSPYFLDYLNEALEQYEDESRVMHIAAYMYPINPEGLPETFFYRAASCWGWGTWRRSWQSFEPETGVLLSRLPRSARNRFNIDGTYDFWRQLELQHGGKVDSWAIRWYASVFLNDGLCLHPSISLVRNIGTDGSGSHSEATRVFDVEVRTSAVSDFEAELHEHDEALARITQYLRTLRPTLKQRIIGRLGRAMKAPASGNE